MHNQSNIIVFRHNPLANWVTDAWRKLDEGLDGNPSLVRASEAWNNHPDRYIDITRSLIDQLLRMGLHSNAMIGTADSVRDNLKEHICGKTDTTPPLDWRSLCKLQAYNAICFLHDITVFLPKLFEKGDVNRLMAIAHLAEDGKLCAVGYGSTYDCLQNLAADKPHIFSNAHIADMAGMSDLDLRPITLRDEPNPYRSILKELGRTREIIFPVVPSIRVPRAPARLGRRIPANDLPLG